MEKFPPPPADGRFDAAMDYLDRLTGLNIMSSAGSNGYLYSRVVYNLLCAALADLNEAAVKACLEPVADNAVLAEIVVNSRNYRVAGCAFHKVGAFGNNPCHDKIALAGCHFETIWRRATYRVHDDEVLRKALRRNHRLATRAMLRGLKPLDEATARRIAGDAGLGDDVREQAFAMINDQQWLAELYCGLEPGEWRLANMLAVHLTDRDVLRYAWQNACHKQPLESGWRGIRFAELAVDGIDREIIGDMALNDPMPEVRRVALQKLTDPAILVKIITAKDLHQAYSKESAGLLLEIKLDAVAKLQDQELRAAVLDELVGCGYYVRNAHDGKSVVLAALVNAIADDAKLYAIFDKYKNTRNIIEPSNEILKKIADPAILLKIAQDQELLFWWRVKACEKGPGHDWNGCVCRHCGKGRHEITLLKMEIRHEDDDELGRLPAVIQHCRCSVCNTTLALKNQSEYSIARRYGTVIG